MHFIDFALIGVSLSMDAFAISMCKGLAMEKFNGKHAFVIAFSFGFFQMLMPILGWALGIQAEQYITAIDHWIAFVLLSLIGGKMIYDAFHEKDDEHEGAKCEGKLDLKELLALSIATSIDALAVGITFAFLDVDILYGSSIIGIVTFILSFIGVAIGNVFGTRFKKRAVVLGGTVLCLMGLKILLEHLGIISF